MNKNQNIKLNSNFDYPNISIIVPARNEEENIENCINSISKLEYPINKIELIIVNDRSVDKTKEILESINPKLNLKIININNDSEKNGILGKAGALHVGISNSTNEFLLFTDADCEVHPKWAATIVHNFINDNSDFIASFTLVKSENLFHKYQGAEWMFLHTMGCGSLNMGITMGCFGNNVAFRKSKYMSFGGYENVEFSVTEDLALLQKFDSKGYKSKYLNTFESSVETFPAQTLKEFIKQHHRWLTGGKGLGIKAAIFVVSSLSIWAGILYCLLMNRYDLAVIVLGSRLFLDMFLLYPVVKEMRQPYNLFELATCSVLFLVNELLSPFYMFFRKVSWKDQVFKT